MQGGGSRGQECEDWLFDRARQDQSRREPWGAASSPHFPVPILVGGGEGSGEQAIHRLAPFTHVCAHTHARAPLWKGALVHARTHTLPCGKGLWHTHARTHTHTPLWKGEGRHTHAHTRSPVERGSGTRTHARTHTHTHPCGRGLWCTWRNRPRPPVRRQVEQVAGLRCIGLPAASGSAAA